MKQKRNLWTAYNLATAYGTRPSSLYEIHDEWAAYCFDEIVLIVGRAIESKLSEVDKTTGKQKHQLKDLLADESQSKTAEEFMRQITKGGAIQGLVGVFKGGSDGST